MTDHRRVKLGALTDAVAVALAAAAATGHATAAPTGTLPPPVTC